MILYQQELRSKELTSYTDFLKRMKTLGDNFLVKGDMWIPSVKEPCNTPGIHIGQDPILKKCLEHHVKLTCSHLSDTIAEFPTKGKKTDMYFELTNKELSLYINGDQYVIASEYLPETEDFCPEFDDFGSIQNVSSKWYAFTDSTLQALINGSSITISGTLNDETIPIRLAKKSMKLRGVQCRKLDHHGEYTLVETNLFDDSVCELIIHMVYSKIECVNIYYIRKY